MNRIDSTVVFRRLERADVTAIARRLLDATAARAAALGVTLTYDEAAVEQLAADGFDPLYGARPLRRAIRAAVEDPLAEQLLSGAVTAGDRVRVRVENGRVSIAREELPLAIPAAAGEAKGQPL